MLHVKTAEKAFCQMDCNKGKGVTFKVVYAHALLTSDIRGKVTSKYLASNIAVLISNFQAGSNGVQN